MQKFISLFVLFAVFACRQHQADRPKVEMSGVGALGLNKVVLQANLSTGTAYLVMDFASTNGFANIYYGDEMTFTTNVMVDYAPKLAAYELTNLTAKLIGKLSDFIKLSSVHYSLYFHLYSSMLFYTSTYCLLVEW